MDEFAIDLDKVLDEFEKSEAKVSQQANENRGSFSSSPLGERRLYHLPSVNSLYNGSISTYSQHQSHLTRLNECVDKIDLGDADFAASSSSFNIATSFPKSSNLKPQRPEKSVLKTVSGPEASVYPSLYSNSGLETSKLFNRSLSNGFTEESEEILTIHLTPVTNLSEPAEIEIKLVSSNDPGLNFDKIKLINDEEPILDPNEINTQMPTLTFSPDDETSKKTQGIRKEEKVVKSVEKQEGNLTGSKHWEALAAELEITDILPQSGSNIVSFDNIERVDVSRDELDNYLKDLEEVNFGESIIEHDELPRGDCNLSLVNNGSRKEDSSEVLVIGGARPKVKERGSPVHDKTPAIEAVQEGKKIIETSQKTELVNSVVKETVIKDGNDSSVILERNDYEIRGQSAISEATPSKHGDDDASEAKEDLTSFSDEIEENSCEEVSVGIEESSDLSNSKLIRPTSLNLPAPLLVNQSELIPEIVEGVLAPVTTETSPSPELSETDSALPPSPEVSQAENGENHLNGENKSVQSDESPQVETCDAEMTVESDDVDPTATLDETEYLPELTEEEQLLGKIKPFWIPDDEAPNCLHCDIKFTVLKRRHHCRGCGKVLCAQCCNAKARIPYLDDKEARVCSPCLVTLNKVSDVERLFSENNRDSSERDRLPVEVIPGSATPSPNHSPSHVATEELENSGPSGWIPNPNNPQDYCSQVSPLQQAQAYSSRPPPVVMVPVGVLKRGDKPKVAKQVIFSDGIRPGGDLSDEIFGEMSPEPKIPSRKSGATGRPQRRVLEKGSPGLKEIDDNIDGGKLLDCLQDESAPPLVFALTKNLSVSVKLQKLDCCLHKECWVFASRGLNCVGQDEVMVVLERLPNENSLPRDIFLLFTSLYDNAPISDLGHLLFPEGLLGSRDHGAFMFIRPTFQCLSKLHFPQAPYLVAVLLQKWEVPWAKVFPLRLLLRLGFEYRYYPCPLVSVRFRKPVYGEIGHTIMSVLADFRNYQYSLQTIPGVVVCMEDKKTTIRLPRNRYSAVCKVVASSNEHVLGLGAAFSMEADSHLVCLQDEEGNYQSQAINIQNGAKKVTGASFIVFSGALKSTTGLTAKSSIVEDGLLVQITPETMVTLKNSFQQMKDFIINCGQVDAAQPEEQIILKWTEDDKNFNIGVQSVIDSRSLEGVKSLKVHNGTDYASERFLIRWTEVFFLSNGNVNQSNRGEPSDPSKLADGVAQAFSLALVSHLPLLVEADLTRIGLRMTLDSEQVGYEAGSKGEPLPGLYMVDCDTALIPYLNLDRGSLTLELVFHVLRK